MHFSTVSSIAKRSTANCSTTQRANAKYVIASTLAGSQLFSARRVWAHADHYAPDSNNQTEQEQTAETKANDQHATPAAPSGADTQSHADADKLDVSGVEVVQPHKPVARAGALNGISFGLGEALLSFIIAGPVILVSLRKRLHS